MLGIVDKLGRIASNLRLRRRENTYMYVYTLRCIIIRVYDTARLLTADPLVNRLAVYKPVNPIISRPDQIIILAGQLADPSG